MNLALVFLRIKNEHPGLPHIQAQTLRVGGSVDSTFNCFNDRKIFVTSFLCCPLIGLPVKWVVLASAAHHDLNIMAFFRFFKYLFQTIGVPSGLCLDFHEGQVNGLFLAADFYNISRDEIRGRVRFCWFHLKNSLASKLII